jgi:hypothetical protein
MITESWIMLYLVDLPQFPVGEMSSFSAKLLGNKFAEPFVNQARLRIFSMPGAEAGGHPDT